MELYLQEVGCEREGAEWSHVEGWRARLDLLEDYCIGALRVGQLRITLIGTEQAVQRGWRSLSPKLMRAGG